MKIYDNKLLFQLFIIGKLYAVFGKRQGRIISADSAYGFGGQFRVLATLPVPESFHLATELRTQTSGLASLQLVFSHWEVMRTRDNESIFLTFCVIFFNLSQFIIIILFKYLYKAFKVYVCKYRL